MKLLATSIFVLATGCITTPSTKGGQTGNVSGPLPFLRLRLSDAPAAFQSVFVTISRTEIGTASDAWVTLSDQPQQFDLLTLQNGATALLGGAELAPDHYTQLRLVVSSASVVAAGVEQPLTVASGAETGVKINLDAEIAAGMTYTLVIDYDAARSIQSTGHGYLMTPVIQTRSLSGAPMFGAAGGDGAGSGDGD